MIGLQLMDTRLVLELTKQRFAGSVKLPGIRRDGKTRSSVERKPRGWRSQKKIGSVNEERRSALEITLGKPGRNSGRGKFENFDFIVGGREEVIHLDIDLKETEKLSYSLKLKQMTLGDLISIKMGRRFALRIKFWDGNSLDGDYMVIPTDVVNDLIGNMVSHEKEEV